MLSKDVNDLITQTGAGTPCGRLMRHYWQPAALSDELQGRRPVVPVRLLGEDLVLYRSRQGQLGLIGRHCPHRGADMCYGRLEDAGLRCAFHGWLFDESGQCLEQPAEEEGSELHKKVTTPAYPVIERAGIVWAYMGDGAPPALPELDCFVAPDSHVFAFKGFMACNWLQALEVGIDPAHASFLHRYLQDEDPAESYGKQFRDKTIGADMPMTRILREYPRPEINVERTAYGLRLIALRNLDNQGMHVRVTNQIFPHAIAIPMSPTMTITQWHVPVDDETSYWYAIFTSFGEAVDKARMRAQRLELYELPDYKPRLNRSNNWGYDPDEQETATYTGMGMDINVHDQWAVESPGAIFDRTKENLARSDVGIAAYRQILRQAISAAAEGGALPMDLRNGDGGTIKGPAVMDTIGSLEDWQQVWKARDRERRERSGWAPDPW